MLDLKTFCKKIEPFINYYKRLIKSYKNTVHHILEKEINLLLQKRGIINMLVSSSEDWHMREYLASYIMKEIKPHMRQLMLWIVRQTFSTIN